MKKYILGIFASMLMVTLVIGTSAFKESKADLKNEPITSYYYEFIGEHGDENDMSLWVKLPSISDYNAFSCPTGSTNSCKIINTTNSGNHPTAVPLDGSGFPAAGAINLDVRLKQ